MTAVARLMAEFTSWENVPYIKKREICVGEVAKVEGCDMEALESWDYENKTRAVLGGQN